MSFDAGHASADHGHSGHTDGGHGGFCGAMLSHLNDTMHHLGTVAGHAVDNGLSAMHVGHHTDYHSDGTAGNVVGASIDAAAANHAANVACQDGNPGW